MIVLIFGTLNDEYSLLYAIQIDSYHSITVVGQIERPDFNLFYFGKRFRDLMTDLNLLGESNDRFDELLNLFLLKK